MSSNVLVVEKLDALEKLAFDMLNNIAELRKVHGIKPTYGMGIEPGTGFVPTKEQYEHLCNNFQWNIKEVNTLTTGNNCDLMFKFTNRGNGNVAYIVNNHGARSVNFMNAHTLGSSNDHFLPPLSIIQVVRKFSPETHLNGYITPSGIIVDAGSVGFIYVPNDTPVKVGLVQTLTEMGVNIDNTNISGTKLPAVHEHYITDICSSPLFIDIKNNDRQSFDSIRDMWAYLDTFITNRATTVPAHYHTDITEGTLYRVNYVSPDSRTATRHFISVPTSPFRAGFKTWLLTGAEFRELSLYLKDKVTTKTIRLVDSK